MSAVHDAGLPPADGPDDPPFDDDQVEQLLDGAGGDVVAAGLRSLAPLVAAARLPATAAEAARENDMTALFRQVRGPKAGPRRSFGVKVVAIAGVLTVASATAAAAAGGLPEPVQNTAASLLARVGISVPGDTGPDSGPGAGVPDTMVPVLPSTAPPAMALTDPPSSAGADAVLADSSEPAEPTEPAPDLVAGAPVDQPAVATGSTAPAAAEPETAPAPPADEEQSTPVRRGDPHPDKETPPGQDKSKPAKPPQPPKTDKPGKPEKP
jgi:hypothetical protein